MSIKSGFECMQLVIQATGPMLSRLWAWLTALRLPVLNFRSEKGPAVALWAVACRLGSQSCKPVLGSPMTHTVSPAVSTCSLFTCSFPS